MCIDIFGRHSEQAENSCHGPPEIGFMITSEGNFAIDGKSLSNVAEAEQQNDAVNLQLVHPCQLPSQLFENISQHHRKISPFSMEKLQQRNCQYLHLFTARISYLLFSSR